MDNVLSSIFPNQDLDYSEEILQKLNFYASQKPLIVVADLNRPAVLETINRISHGLLGTFGVDDEVIFGILFGDSVPTGKLPFEIPSSMSEVMDQLEDVPDDTKDPTFEIGFTLLIPDYMESSMLKIKRKIFKYLFIAAQLKIHLFENHRPLIEQ